MDARRELLLCLNRSTEGKDCLALTSPDWGGNVMGNLEKVLIVIILATIAIITALAFLDSGSEPGDDLTARRAASSELATEDEKETDDTAPADRDEEDRNDRPSQRDEDASREYTGRVENEAGDVESFFRNRAAGSADETDRNGETVEQPNIDESTDTAVASREEVEATNRSGWPSANPQASEEREQADERPLRAPELSSKMQSPATQADEARDSSSSGRDTSRYAYTPGSRRYVTTAGDTWASIAQVVYGNRQFADAVRDANIDVATDGADRLKGGIALYIVPRRELERDLDDPERVVQSHIVKKGETLSEISRLYYEQERRWKDILRANGDLLETDRDLRPGMVLRIPPK